MSKTSIIIKRERLRRNWSQVQLAIRLETTNVSVSRWEREDKFPSSYFRERLCEVFDMLPEDLFPELFPAPPLQLVPGDDGAEPNGETSDLDKTIEEVVQVLRSTEQTGYEEQEETQRINQKTDTDTQLEVEIRRLELKRQRLQFQKEQREDEREKRAQERDKLEHALQMAEMLIASLEPEADQATKTKLLRTLLPQLLRSGEESSKLGRLVSMPLKRREQK